MTTEPLSKEAREVIIRELSESEAGKPGPKANALRLALREQPDQVLRALHKSWLDAKEKGGRT